MKHRPRKIITRVIVFVLAGAIVNVAVAWGCSLWVDPWRHGFVQATQSSTVSRTHPDYGMLVVWRMKRAGATDIKVNRWRGNRDPAIDEAPLLSLLPEWTELREPSEAFKAGAGGQWARGGAGAEVVIVEARGWPVLSMCVWHGVTVPLTGVWTRHGWNTSSIRRATEMNGAPYSVALPLHPIWPGFAINTVFYAAVLAALFLGPGMVRRALRHRRGLCPACGYPVGTSDKCTECGATHGRFPSGA